MNKQKTSESQDLKIKNVGQNVTVYLSKTAKSLSGESKFSIRVEDKPKRQKLLVELAKHVEKYERAKTDNGRIKVLKEIAALTETEYKTKKREAVKKNKDFVKNTKSKKQDVKSLVNILEEQELSEEQLTKLQSIIDSKSRKISSTKTQRSGRTFRSEY